MIREFFEFVYGELAGEAPLVRLNSQGEASRDKWFSYPEQLDEMVEFVEEHSGEDVYFTPTLMRAHSRRKTAVHKCQVVFGDADTLDLSTLKIEPSAVVHTSEGHTHVYWLLSDVQDPLEIEQINRSVSQNHDKASTGYDTGWAANKLLRVPGSKNTKKGNNFEVTVEYNGMMYSEAEITEAYPKVWTGSAERKDLPNEADLPSRRTAIARINYSTELHDLLTSEFRKGYGSEALYAAIQELFRCGATDEETFVLLLDSEVNKWRRDDRYKDSNDADERLWDDIIRARAKSEVEVEEAVKEYADPVDTHTESAIEPKMSVEDFDFLSEEEKSRLRPNFVSEYVSWAKSKTKAPECFMEASAFSILSSIFGDFGHLPMNWGDMNLNLWFMALGRSTVDRKTTVKNLMSQFLRACEVYPADEDDAQDAYSYLMSANATIEGMSVYMLSHPNRSGLLARDEFQGFLSEMTKSYMSGAKDALTDFYNGNINGRLRSSSEKKDVKSTKYALSMYAMGIRNQVAEVLTTEDFRSGFLTRFIWAIPEENDDKMVDINEGFDIAPRDRSTAGSDPVFNRMLAQVKSGRDFWEGYVDPTTAVTEPIFPSHEAMERIRVLRTDMMEVIQKFGKEEAQSSADRLSQSVLRGAALLAMVDQRSDVELDDVLAVIYYCGDWFRNMLLMVEDVAESDWAATLDKVIEALVVEGGSMLSKNLYAQFRTEYRPREWSEVMHALQDAGIIRLTQVEGNRKEMEVTYLG